MRSSNKNRSRSKSSRKSIGNIVNRVFESAGPEGKVRGTPQQIIEKYTTLSRDAQTAGDRVAAENFMQHAEHYIRMLSEAQRESGQRPDNSQAQTQQSEDASEDQAAETGTQAPSDNAMATIEGETAESSLVETPENAEAPAEPAKPATRSRSRTPRRRTSSTRGAAAADAKSDEPAAGKPGAEEAAANAS